jgi:hypothetical protein
MKGFFTGLIIDFAIAVFVVLFVIIFIFAFKVHITQAMVDYYLWGKENDIPMSLFSSDIKGESSAVALNRIFYNGKDGRDYSAWKTQMIQIIDRWFVENSGQKTFQLYQFELGDVVIEEELSNSNNPFNCNCKAEKLYGVTPPRYYCKGNCGSHENDNCPETYDELSCTVYCMEIACISTIQRTNLGLYPLPIIYNGTDRIVTLKFNTIIGTEKS